MPALLLSLLAALGAAPADEPPPLPREFRAAWVATVGNIDWPSRRDLPPDAQRAEADRILDLLARLHFNAVVLQVRPAADALYASELEPWSVYLTGEQGRAPEPGYDPLAYWVEGAHRRGIQLHAWFNPFRAGAGVKREELAPSHLARQRPELVKAYGTYLWMDPGEPDARARTVAVIRDVVRRYDVDGVHFDDYFYPYAIPDPADPAKKAPLDFPDEPSWRRYTEGGGTLARADWRRENINGLIRELHAAIRAEKPHVLFGISPFGIPRPGRVPGVVGFDQYEGLYADAELWLREGWCDYFSPQLYWKIESAGQPFRPLLDYWVGANPKGVAVWPGLSVSRVSPTGYPPEEIVNQIAITRETAGASGNILFSMKALLEDRRGINGLLVETLYTGPAVRPEVPTAGVAPPGAPAVAASRRDGETVLSIRPGPGAPPATWAVQVRQGDAWTLRLHPAAEAEIALPGDAAGFVTAVGRTGVASGRVAFGGAPRGG
jgi:uncharacterized lipoprotein YddW (UPF0748 family)